MLKRTIHPIIAIGISPISGSGKSGALVETISAFLLMV
jgi:hypothetical protein